MSQPVRKLVRVDSLKPGDRFNFRPRAWFGPGVVRASYGGSGGIWTLKFDAPVVNPPGVWYGDPEQKVFLLRPRRLLARGQA